MSRNVFASLVGGASLLAFTATAQAAAVSTNTWYLFGFSDVGSDLISGAGFVSMVNPATVDAPNGPWEFTLSGLGELFVVDGFLSVDQFEMFDFGGSIGLTSANTDGSDCDDDLTCAINDLNFSRGSYALAAGNHSITGIVVASGVGGGAGAFIIRDLRPVPLPAALPLFASALAGLGGVSWLRRRKA